MRIGTVYAVFVEEEIRYIGQTWQPLKKRLTKHLNSEPRDQSYRANLFRKCKRLGVSVRIQSVSSGLLTQNDLDDCEKYWIKHFQLLGCRLVNASEGGGTGRPKVDTIVARFRSMTGILEDDEKFICQTYPKMNTHELARKFRVKHQCISHVLQRNGVRLRSNKEAQGGLSAEKELEIVKDYSNGLSGPELESRYGVSNNTIYRILKRNKTQTRSMSDALMILDELQTKVSFEQYSSGTPLSEIAQIVGVCNSSVILRAFKKFGYPIKKHWKIESSDGLIFDTVEEASNHYQLTVSTIRTAFTNKECRVTFRRLPPTL
jgi:Mor family transcriptional regulator